MEKTDQPLYYLDAFKRVAAEMLLETIIPVIARNAESKEDRQQWAAEIAFAMVSGILVKLANRYPKDVDDLFGQAKMLAKDFASEDLRKCPQDYLPERRERWIEKLKTLPTYPTRKHSPNTGQPSLTELQALILYEDAINFVHQIYAVRKESDEDEIIASLKEKFPALTKNERKGLAYDIKTKFPIKGVALNIAAGVAGVTVESFDKLLRGARKRASEINEALNVR